MRSFRKRLSAILMISLLTTGFCAAETVPKQVLSTQIDTLNQMTIEIDISGNRAPAIIDSAATIFMLDNALLDVDPDGQNDRVDILGLDGIDEYNTVKYGPVTIGETTLFNVRAAMNDRRDFIGHRSIVPLNAIPGRTVDFNFYENEILFGDGRPERQPRAHIISRLKFEEINGLPFVNVKLNGKRGRALIDTGSSATFINSVFADVAEAETDEDKTRYLLGTAFAGVGIKVVKGKHFRIGAHEMTNFNMLVADPFLFEHLGLQDEPTMLIGLDSLKRFRMQFDRKKRIIILGHDPTH